MATQFAIFRVAKVKSHARLSGLSRHHMRTRETLNADPDGEVVVLHGSGDPHADVKALLPEKVRKNAVLAMEHLLTASPAYFRPDNPDVAGTYDQKRLDAWTKQAMAWLHREYGDNLASAVLHLDESTPHIQALVVPKRPDGKLDAATLFTPDALVRKQDTYAEALAPLGIERGIHGSKRKHEPIKKEYGRAAQEQSPEVKTKVPKVEPPTVVERLKEAVGMDTVHSAAVAKAEAARQKRMAEAKEREAVLLAKAARAESAERKLKDRDATLTNLRKSTDLLREIPLTQVLERAGAEPDPKDKNNWRTIAGRISIEAKGDKVKFFNHDLGKGGGGAIDLTMQLHGCDYKQAVGWLADNFGSSAAVAAHVQESKRVVEQQIKTLPRPELDWRKAHAPAPAKLAKVKKYLTEARKLPEKVVDLAISQGKLWADKFGNCCFALVDAAGQHIGLELRGTGDGNTYHGVRGDKGVFVAGQLQQNAKAVVVESAIDALSVNAVSGMTAISTTGSGVEVASAMVVKQRLTAIGGFDGDKAGDGMHQKLSERLNAVLARIWPDKKDWNGWLQHTKGDVQPIRDAIQSDLSGGNRRTLGRGRELER